MRLNRFALNALCLVPLFGCAMELRVGGSARGSHQPQSATEPKRGFISNGFLPVPGIAVATVTAGSGLTGGGTGSAVSLAFDPTYSPTFAGVDIGSGGTANLLDVKGNGNQINLESTASAATLLFANNGSLIWDFDPTPAVNTDAQTFRFFRHTTTSGALNIDLGIGNSSSVGTRLSGKGVSFFTRGLTVASSSTATDALVVGMGNTAQTATSKALNVNATGGTFDTTAGVLTSYGVWSSVPSARSTGSNALTNVALYGNASGAQTNWAVYADNGNVRIGSGHIQTQGASVSLTNATCNSSTCNDISGTVTASSTSMTITFASTYTGADDAGCTLQEMGGTVVPTFTTSATALTATVVVNGAKYHYICLGH